MTTETITPRSTTFTIGWITLLVISGLATLNHMMLPVYGDDIALAIGWVGYSLYATVVLASPFRRGERWAWYASWILVIGFASPILLDLGKEMIGVVMMYLIAAGLMALCLLVTRPAFFRKQ